MTPRLTLSAVAVAAALAVSACGLGSPDSVISAGSMTTPSPVSPSSTADSAGAASTQPDSPTTEVPDTSDTTRTPLSPAEAGSAAAGRHTGSAVVAIELDRAHGTTVWEVTVVSADGRWKVDVDVSDGSVLGDKSDDPDDAPKYLDRLSRASLDHAAAIEAVLATHAGSTLAELDLDDEDGTVVWEAEIVTPAHQKYDVTIDASTGSVLKDVLDD